MPRTRDAAVRTEDLPDVATISEIAAYERIDERTLRKAIVAGKVAGVVRRGRAVRIVTQRYLAATGCDG